MASRKLAIAVVGLALMVGGPAATLVTPEPARADPPPTCQQVCSNEFLDNLDQCRGYLPPLPTQDDELMFEMCFNEAVVIYVACDEGCPPPPP